MNLSSLRTAIVPSARRASRARPAPIRLPLTKMAGAALIAVAALSLAACETTGSPAPAVQAAPVSAASDNPMAPDTVTKTSGPMTHRQAALYCWMSTEHGHADMALDKRADVVDACIKQKMAEH